MYVHGFEEDLDKIKPTTLTSEELLCVCVCVCVCVCWLRGVETDVPLLPTTC